MNLLLVDCASRLVMNSKLITYVVIVTSNRQTEVAKSFGAAIQE